MSSESKRSVLALIRQVEDQVTLLQAFDKTVSSTLKEFKKANNILTALLHGDENPGQYLVELQVLASAFEIVTSYINKFIKHNGFDWRQKNDIAVPLDLLYYFNENEKELQEIYHEKQEGKM